MYFLYYAGMGADRQTEQIGLATGQIRHADESYKVSEQRMEEGLQGALPSEVLLGIRSLEQAHFNHLQAIQGLG